MSLVEVGVGVSVGIPTSLVEVGVFVAGGEGLVGVGVFVGGGEVSVGVGVIPNSWDAMAACGVKIKKMKQIRMVIARGVSVERFIIRPPVN
jgi:hypothetical protein